MKAVIVYGSTTGSTETASKWVAETLKSNGAEVQSIDAAKASVEVVGGADLIVLGSSTWGEGDIQDDFQAFYDAMHPDYFKNKKVAVFGCGDSGMFPHVFCEAVTLIEEKSLECGAELVREGLRIDGAVQAFESEVRVWASGLVA